MTMSPPKKLCYLTLTTLFVVHLQTSSAVSPHAAVIGVEAEEAQLPPELKSQALRNPRLRQELLKSSWFHRGENPVSEREAEKISRKGIYKILIHAGFVPRNGGHQAAPELGGPAGLQGFSGLQGLTGQQDVIELQGPSGNIAQPPNYFHEPELSLQFI